MGHINKSSKSQKYGFLSFVISTKSKVFGVCQGAQIFRPIDFVLLTSQKCRGGYSKCTALRPARLCSFKLMAALPVVAILAVFASGIYFSHSAYAASYVNVSSGGSGDTAGVVSLGKIKPSSSGSTATGNDTLTVHTDCSAGYKVYVSGQNGKTTNLTNQSATDPTNPSAADIISASSNTIVSPAVLSANTWGISGSSTDIENHFYAGLPAYADATSTALVTKTNVEEESTVPIYYGVNANTAINPGTYSGDILYTVLMDTSCIPYTVEFNPNVTNSADVTGEMVAQSILPNSATALTANAYKRSGYAFLGWSESADGKTGNVTNGIGTEADVDYANGAEVNNLTTGGTSKTLYAIWIALDGTMQNFAGCSTLSNGDVKYLRDTRDDTNYRIKKIGDECWMTENLVLGYDKGYALTSADTNIPSNDDGTLSNNGTYYLPQAGYSGALNSSSTTGSAVFDNSTRLDQAQVQYRAVGSAGDQNSIGTLGQSTGYYNFYAATLGCSYYSDGNSNCRSGYVAKDICPKGWQLPLGGSNTTKSWVSLDKALNGSSAGSNRNDSTARNRFLNDAGFLYSGRYLSSQLYYVGSRGRWWSSTVYNTNNSYTLYLDPSGFVNPQDSNYKYNGFAVRCVAQSHYIVAYNANSGTGTAPAAQSVMENGGVTTQANTFTRDGYNFLGWSTNASATTADYSASSAQNVNDIVSAAATSGQTTTDGSTITLYAVWEEDVKYMQDFMCTNSSIASGETKTLVDKRDGQEYTVYRIPTDNAATNVAGKCIMTKDLNLGAVNSVSGSSSTITVNGTMTLSPEDSTFTTPSGSGESITVPTSNVTVSMTWNTSDSYSNRHYHTNGTGDYAGRGYYSWGAAMVACPKGWRLPTQDELNNNDSYNSSTIGISKAVNNSLSTLQSSPWSFVLGGYYINGFGFAGSNGYYWSSTQYGSMNSYTLNLNSSNGLERGSNNKRCGFAVRCMADDYDNTMQDFDSSSLTNVGDTAKLLDTRDNKIYTVKKLPDGKVWMMQNLTIGSDGAKTLTKDDTNIDNNTTYYLPPAGKQSSSTIDNSSTLTATTTANFTGNSSTDAHAKTQFRTKSTSYTNDSDTGYYNFYTATLGFSYYQDGKSSGTSTRDICPKGWRLPKTTDSGTNVTTVGSANDFTYLALQYNSSTGWSGSATGTNGYGYYNNNNVVKNPMYLQAAYPLATSTANNYAGFSYAGFWYGTNSSASDVGSAGYYWSASVYDTNNGYYLYFDSSDVYPQDDFSKLNGFAVRCVAK